MLMDEMGGKGGRRQVIDSLFRQPRETYNQGPWAQGPGWNCSDTLVRNQFCHHGFLFAQVRGGSMENGMGLKSPREAMITRRRSSVPATTRSKRLQAPELRPVRGDCDGWYDGRIFKCEAGQVTFELAKRS